MHILKTDSSRMKCYGDRITVHRLFRPLLPPIISTVMYEYFVVNHQNGVRVFHGCHRSRISHRARQRGTFWPRLSLQVKYGSSLRVWNVPASTVSFPLPKVWQKYTLSVLVLDQLSPTALFPIIHCACLEIIEIYIAPSFGDCLMTARLT